MAGQGPHGLPHPSPDLCSLADMGRRPSLRVASPTTPGTTVKGQYWPADFAISNFSLAPAQLRGIVGDGAVSIVAGVVFAIIGANQAGAFLVFTFLSFIGVVYFYRAFTLTFSGAGSRRYGYLVFFLPTLLFWTSDVSKEAIMTFLLGLTAYGCARILAHRGRGYLLIIVCSVAGAWIRPNETLLALGGFTVAMLVRPADPTRPVPRAPPHHRLHLSRGDDRASPSSSPSTISLVLPTAFRSPQSPRTIPELATVSAAAASPTPPIPSTSPGTSLSSCSIRYRSTPTARGSGSKPSRTHWW